MSKVAEIDTSWSDEPLGVDGVDELGRGPFVRSVVAQIEKARQDTQSTVFGLVGPWGSGKTSLLKRIQAHLEAEWIVTEFAPWSSADSSAMALEFVSTLVGILDISLEGDARRKVVRYASFAVPLASAIPWVGAGLEGVASNAIDALSERKPWHQQFEEISQHIQALDKRVLIVVDDVDRLGSDELMTLLRLLRMLGRFRGVHYIIAYDQATVEDLIQLTGRPGRAAAFMEKIVQHPFETPPVSRASSLRLINSLFEDLLTRTGNRLDENDMQRAAELLRLISDQIRTPRTIGRFRESLIAFSSHVQGGQLDLIDYIAISWLRLSAHGVWEAIPRAAEALISGKWYWSDGKSDAMLAEDWLRFIGESDAAANPQQTHGLLAFMFQGVGTVGSYRYLAHERSVSDYAYLGRYLLLAVPEDDVSDVLVDSVAHGDFGEEWKQDARQLAAIIDGNDDALASLAVSRLVDALSQGRRHETAIFDYLLERYQARVEEKRWIGAPRALLWNQIKVEGCYLVLEDSLSVADVQERVGGVDGVRIAWAASDPLLRERRAEILSKFASYWRAKISDDYDSVRMQGVLPDAAAVVAWETEAEESRGILSGRVSDYESFVELAMDFVHVDEWIGSTVTYELELSIDDFIVLVGKVIFDEYAERLVHDSGSMSYRTSDILSADIPVPLRRAFAIDRLARHVPLAAAVGPVGSDGET